MRHFQHPVIRFLGGLLVVTLIMASCSGCAVNGEWTKRDTGLEIAFQAVNMIDARSTANIHRDPNRVEVNPIPLMVLGDNPDPRDTYVYFGTMALSHWLISRALPPKWRPWFQGGTTAMTTHSVIINCEAGLCQ